MTAKLFDAHGIDFRIVIEPQEYDEYAKALGEERLLPLPFSNLGLGSYPARNFCWDHAISNGYSRHWIFDDNIEKFYFWENARRRPFSDLERALSFVEEYADTANVDLAGFEEPNMCPRPPMRAFKRNCHVYSAMLIRNSIPYRWRLKYNEDVDLCLQVLTNGGSTAACVYYLADKISTSRKMRGGNQDELYQGNNPMKKRLKAEMLRAVWPDFVKVVFRFNRPHHFVDWNVFKKKQKSR